MLLNFDDEGPEPGYNSSVKTSEYMFNSVSFTINLVIASFGLQFKG